MNMFTSKLRLVPWRNKQEWEDVYKNAFSKDPALQKSACDIMDLWMILRDDIPPGVDCTASLLKVLLVGEKSSSHDLRLMYSTAVLRVINFVCDNGRKMNPNTLTLYQVAKSLNIPDWIINMRHDISHGKTLPNISMLKMASEFLLQWLKEYYWEIEKENLNQVIIHKSRDEVFKESIEFLLSVYSELSLAKEKGVTNTSDLLDADLLNKFHSLSEHSARRSVSTSLPWLEPSPALYDAAKKNNFLNKPVDEILEYILKLLKEYIINDLYGFDCLAVLAAFLNKHCSANDGLNRGMWKSLIQLVNRFRLLDRLMLSFSEANDTESAKPSKLWLNELILAVQKRQRVEQMKESISTPSDTYLDEIEEKLARKILLKKRLNLTECTKEELYAVMFKRVEKASPHLRNVIRLKDTVSYFPDNCLIQKMIENVLHEPNSNSLSMLDELFQLMTPRYPPKIEKQLKTLVRIYLGDRVRNLLERPNKIASLVDLCPQETMEVDADDDPVNKAFYRTGWDFNGCCLGTTPWSLEGVQYYPKPFQQEMDPPFIFPLS